MASAYDLERVDGMRTLGDSAEAYDRDSQAFVQGVHWALDRLTGEVERLGIPVPPDYVDRRAAEILRKAKAREL